MESTLHRQLKLLYARDEVDREVLVRGYRIDAVQDERLIEIQSASLSSLKQKTLELLQTHAVTVVKPLALRKRIIRRDRPDGPIVSERFSPSRATVMNLFDELVYFLPAFPHPRLRIEVLLVEWEEHRVTKVPRRRFRKDYRVTDRVLCDVASRVSVETPRDLLGLLPAYPAAPFTTRELADCCGIPRWRAQKAAYCLHGTGALARAGKRGSSHAYRYARGFSPRRRAA